MQVIMTATGQLKTVPDGYARNFLLPQKMAIAATPQGVKDYEANKEKIDAAAAVQRSEYAVVAQQLSSLNLTLSAKASPQGKLFSAVHAPAIVQALQTAGVSVTEQMLTIPTLKQVGTYPVMVRLPGQTDTTVTVTIQAA